MLIKFGAQNLNFILWNIFLKNINTMLLFVWFFFSSNLKTWKLFCYRETKIVLRGNTTQHLVELERKALRLGLPTYLVQDAGRTQVSILLYALFHDSVFDECD